jgi:hypothetical protein
MHLDDGIIWVREETCFTKPSLVVQFSGHGLHVHELAKHGVFSYLKRSCLEMLNATLLERDIVDTAEFLQTVITCPTEGYFCLAVSNGSGGWLETWYKWPADLDKIVQRADAAEGPR